ncbi:membrane dipeptidase [Clostridium sp.]|uniref:dipeptidase n=1 Tax=Clostridium sp. TaxID=1506 RepID=UPI001A376B46|nr:membrane dipeptidase [Clostridium sp.]MBK5242593.1 membrane dipeptidase [Clostridium sp.]
MDIHDIIKDMTIIDGHTDIPRDVYLKELHGKTNVFMNFHYPQLKRTGVNIIFANVFTKTIKEFSVNETLLQIEKMINATYENKDVIIIKDKKDLASVLDTGKLGVILSIEGFSSLNDTVNLLNIYYELGLRSGMLTWNYANSLANGADCDEGGLTEMGKLAIEKMNELGIIVDVSHLNEPGFWDVLKYNKNLTIASHSNSKALYNHRRNLTDEQMKAIANGGGVIGALSYFAKVCDPSTNSPHQDEDFTETVHDFIQHIEYMVNLVGYDHVAFGFDFNMYFGDYAVNGLESADNISDVIQLLLERGHKLEDISKIAGGNLIRVLNEILK